jgi:hypothetical protein
LSSTAAIQLVQQYGSVEEAQKHAAEAGVYSWEFVGITVDDGKVTSTEASHAPGKKTEYITPSGDIGTKSADAVQTGATTADINSQIDYWNATHAGQDVITKCFQTSFVIDGVSGESTTTWQYLTAGGEVGTFETGYQYLPGGDTYTQVGGKITYADGRVVKNTDYWSEAELKKRGGKGQGSTAAAPGLSYSLASAPSPTGEAVTPSSLPGTTGTLAEIAAQLLAMQQQSGEVATFVAPVTRGYVPMAMRPRVI